MQDSYTVYISRDSGFHQLNPLTKLTLVLFLAVCALFIPGLWTAYIVFLVALLPLAFWGRVLGPFLDILWKFILPFALSVFLIQGFLWTEGTPIFTIGPVSLKMEGVLFSITSIGRILGISSSFLLFSLVTRPDNLMIALEERGVPNSLTYIVLSTLQIVPSFRAKANTIVDAQHSRGLETEGSFRKRIRALLPLVEPLVLGSIMDIDERAIALEARAFSRKGQRTFLRTIADTRFQRILRWLLLAAALLIIIGRLAYPWLGRLAGG